MHPSEPGTSNAAKDAEAGSGPFRGLSNKGLAKRGTATSAFNNIRLTNRILLPQPLRLSGYSQCQHLKTDEQLSSFIKSGSL